LLPLRFIFARMAIDRLVVIQEGTFP